MVMVLKVEPGNLLKMPQILKVPEIVSYFFLYAQSLSSHITTLFSFNKGDGVYNNDGRKIKWTNYLHRLVLGDS